MTHLHDIEGIAEASSAKLNAAGVGSIEDLLDHGGTAAGRAKLVEASGIAHGHILKWVNHADLFRIKGIGGEYAELLEAAGVDTVAELAHRNAENLTAKLAEANEEKHLVRQVPGLAAVTKWIAEAKELPSKVSH